MDRGIWATWYDLPEGGAGEYLSWLHESYLPAMLRRPGYLWAAHVRTINTPERERDVIRRLVHTDDRSVPGGNDYVLLFGAADPQPFVDPAPSELEAELSAEDRSFLGRRAGERSCIFVEVARIAGQAVKQRAPGITPGPAVQFGTFNANKPENDLEISTWYARSRLPLCTTLPGCIGARKLVSVAGWAKHAILYEFVSIEAAQTQLVDNSEWTERVVANLVHAPHSPSLGTRIWP